MIKHYKWKKTKDACFIMNYDLYTIESNYNGKVYAIEGNEFAFIGRNDAYRCDIEDMPQLVHFLPKYKDEIMEIYNEIPELRRLNII